jgi:hypothetical protein
MASTAPSAARIRYDGLNSTRQEIRILEVAPANDEDIIECTIKRVSLMELPAPNFETISYTWGTRKDTSQMIVNGSKVAVPYSSEAAIRCMRLQDRPRALWIDAICIDQSSLVERSEQVSLMGTIYRMSKKNLVYLGEDDGTAERGMKAIQDLVSEMRAETDDYKSYKKPLSETKIEPLLDSDTGFGVEIDFEPLERLFEFMWFR